MSTLNSGNEFKFRIGVSSEPYSSKNEVRSCCTQEGAKVYAKEKLCFNNNSSITIDEFCSYISKGYAFCNIFKYDSEKQYKVQYKDQNGNVKTYVTSPEYKRGKNKGFMKLQFKRDDFFSGSQCIFVDIDETKYLDLDDYLKVVDPKPTISYYTYSDREGSRRFRLCYVFDKIISIEDFNTLSAVITNMVSASTKEVVKDTCGTRASQYFNGTDGKEVKCSYIVYSAKDFAEYCTEDPASEHKKEMEKKLDIKFTYSMIISMKLLPYEEFMHKYSWMKYWWRCDNGQWINGLVQVIDDDYFSLYWNRERLKDGDSRRKKLYQRMCLRRVMRPESTPDEILFCSYVDLERFVDNTVDKITVEQLIDNVKSCFSMSVEEIKKKYGKSIDKMKAKAPKKGLIYKNKKSVHEGNMSLLDTLYDRNKTVLENLDIIKSNGFDFSLMTLYRYCKERGISIKKYSHSDEEILSMIDFSASIRKNQQTLKEQGIEVSRGKLFKIIAKAAETQE